MKIDTPKTLPEYAKNTPIEFLARVFCDRCGSAVWAKLDKAYPGIDAIRDAETGEYEARCLKCNNRIIDNYNWTKRK
jgi:hypothetical protein